MNARPIIAGVDESPESFRAAAAAWRLARAADVPCILVYAVPQMWAPGGSAPLVNSPEIVATLTANVRRLLARELGAEIPSAVRDALVARSGCADVVLADVARESGASLIVVGGRHRGAWAGVPGGGTAHHLVRTADAPVLVVEAWAQAPEPWRAGTGVPVCTWCDPRSGRCA